MSYKSNFMKSKKFNFKQFNDYSQLKQLLFKIMPTY
jgi:hypothetical protein